MIKSKVFEILSRLDKDSIKQFGDFVRSPFFNHSKPVIKLYDEYRKFYPDFNNKRLTKEKVLKKIYPDKIYNDLRFRNLNSDLLELAEKYLAIKNISREPMLLPLYSLHEINKLNIYPLFQKCYKQTEKMISNHNSRDSKFFYYYHWLYGEKDIYNTLTGKFNPEDVKKMESGFIKYFLSIILRIYCYILNLKSTRGFEYEFSLDKELMEHLGKHKFIHEPSIAIPFNRMMLHSTDFDEYYFKLRELTEKYGHLLERANLYDTYIYMINYVKHSWPKGRTESLMELYNLRKSIFSKKFMTTEGYITYIIFLNHVKICLRLKYYDEVYSFINKYKDTISEEIRENTYNLSLALYYFETGDLKSALLLSSKVTYQNTRFTLEVKLLYAQIYWLQNEENALLNHIDSFKTYIKRNPADKNEEKSECLLFIKALEEMIKIKNRKQYYKIKHVISKLEKSELCQNKWLIYECNKLSE